MKVYLVSLGCPKNTVDAEATLGLLQRAGCEAVADPREANVLVVNACSFLDSAWRETVEELEELARFKEADPRKTLVLMGCLPLHRGSAWRAPLSFVDHFLPAGAHARLPALVGALRGGRAEAAQRAGEGFDRFAGYENRPRITPRHIAYVKIAEGCDRACAFCAIPVIRGGMQSRSVESIVREVEAHEASGVREITLIAQDLTAYADGRRRLPDLVDAVASAGVEWIRVFYLHPAALTLELARRLFEHPSVCRYLEVPVQHASDRVLRSMGRPHTRAGVERVLEGIRGEFPGIVLRSEVMVGYPGEDEDDFDELKSFVESVGFASLGVFVYSPEPGTRAASLDARVRPEVASERAAEIADLQRSVTLGLLSEERGRVHRILVDRPLDEGGEARGAFSCAGRYYGQAYEIDGEVYLDAAEAAVGEFVNARITGADAFDLEAELEDPQRP